MSDPQAPRDAKPEVENDMAIRKAALGARWASVTDVGDKLRQAKENRQAQRRLLDQLEVQVQRRRKSVDESLADLPSSQRVPLVNRAVAGRRGELKRETADQRTAYVREAARLSGELQAVRDHYKSPIQILMRKGLGSERRSRVLQQIEASGPAELASLAEFAAATKDMDLGAALCSRVANLMPNQRPFSAQDLAHALVGDEHRLVTLSIMEAERLAEEALNDEATFERGAPDNHRLLKIARMIQAEQAFAEGAPAAEDDETTPHQQEEN
jgi:hypothetical protein